MEERESVSEGRKEARGPKRGRTGKEGNMGGAGGSGGGVRTCCPTKILRAINSPTTVGRWSAQKSRPPLFARSIFDRLPIRQNIGHHRDEWGFHRATPRL